MEMDVHEGQRREKATGKISFLGPPYLPASYLASLPRSRGRTPVFVCGDEHVQSKRELLGEKKHPGLSIGSWASARRSTFHPEPSQLTPQFHLLMAWCDLALIYVH